MANYLFGQNLIAPSVVQKKSYPAVSDDLQFVWPTALTNDTNVFAIINEVTTTSAGVDLFLPPANQVGVGQQGVIFNLGTDNIDVYDFDGVNLVVSVAATQAILFYVRDNSAASGTNLWKTLVYGAGTAAANAVDLAGFGLYAAPLPFTTQPVLNTYYKVEALGAGVNNINMLQQASLLTATSNVTQIVLPVQPNFYVAINNVGTTTIPVRGSVNGTLFNDQAQPLNLLAKQNAIFVCDGTNYTTIGLPPPPFPVVGSLRLGASIVSSSIFTVTNNNNPTTILSLTYTANTLSRPLIIQASIAIRPPVAPDYATAVAGGGCIVTLTNVNTGVSVVESFGQLNTVNSLLRANLLLRDTSPAATGATNYTVSVTNATGSTGNVFVNTAPANTIGLVDTSSNLIIYEVV